MRRTEGHFQKASLLFQHLLAKGTDRQTALAGRESGRKRKTVMGVCGFHLLIYFYWDGI